MIHLIECVPNKTEDVNLSAFNLITRINEWKTLTQHISYQCKCKFHGKKCICNQKWYNNKSQYECKNLRKHNVWRKDYIWKTNTCSCENGKYLGSIIRDSVTMCDEIIEVTQATPTKPVPTKTIPTNFNGKR